MGCIHRGPNKASPPSSTVLLHLLGHSPSTQPPDPARGLGALTGRFEDTVIDGVTFLHQNTSVRYGDCQAWNWQNSGWIYSLLTRKVNIFWQYPSSTLYSCQKKNREKKNVEEFSSGKIRPPVPRCSCHLRPLLPDSPVQGSHHHPNGFAWSCFPSPVHITSQTHCCLLIFYCFM